MPEKYQKIFIIDDKIVSFRFHNGLYHARYRRKGYNIEVCAKSFELMKNKFIERLNKIERERALNQFPTFGEFLNDWLTVKKTDSQGKYVQKLRWTFRIQFTAPFRGQNLERDHEKGRAGFRFRVDRRRKKIERRIKRCN